MAIAPVPSQGEHDAAERYRFSACIPIIFHEFSRHIAGHFDFDGLELRDMMGSIFIFIFQDVSPRISRARFATGYTRVLSYFARFAFRFWLRYFLYTDIMHFRPHGPLFHNDIACLCSPTPHDAYGPQFNIFRPISPCHQLAQVSHFRAYYC